MQPRLSHTTKLHCPSFGITCDRWSRDDLPTSSPCRWCYAKTGTTRIPRNYGILVDNRAWIDSVRAHDMAEDSAYALSKLIHGENYFRWHHAGDLTSQQHTDLILNVCTLTPETLHWLPVTPQSFNAYVRRRSLPGNLVVRISAPIIDKPLAAPGSTVVYTQSAPGGCYVCPGECGTCRVCWDNPELRVAYRWHGDAIVRKQARKAGLNV